MRQFLTVTLATAALGCGSRLTAADPPFGFPKFRVQEIATDLTIGYGVIVADINGDGKPDIVIADKHRVVWYENPSWKPRVLLKGKTKPDNVCLAALDIDGGGDLELVLGAGWNPSDTTTPGTLQWLKRGKSPDDEWAVHPIPCDDPTVHRVRAIDLDGDGKPEVVCAPLHGRGATAKGNWTDGRPTRITAYQVPADPARPESWKPAVLSEELHVVHNFAPMNVAGAGYLLTASYEGVRLLMPAGDRWQATPITAGNQALPDGPRGASEVKVGKLGGPPDPVNRFAVPPRFLACVEPWHGNQVVVYTDPPERGRPWTKHVLDARLRWGHAVQCADLDGDGTDELIVGVRDDPDPKGGDAFPDRRGVRIYKAAIPEMGKWRRYVLEDGGVAVEDLAVADLNGDGKPDIVAVGRQTKNCRIYWNEGIVGKR